MRDVFKKKIKKMDVGKNKQTASYQPNMFGFCLIGRRNLLRVLVQK